MIRKKTSRFSMIKLYIRAALSMCLNFKREQILVAALLSWIKTSNFGFLRWWLFFECKVIQLCEFGLFEKKMSWSINIMNKERMNANELEWRRTDMALLKVAFFNKTIRRVCKKISVKAIICVKFMKAKSKVRRYKHQKRYIKVTREKEK